MAGKRTARVAVSTSIRSPLTAGVRIICPALIDNVASTGFRLTPDASFSKYAESCVRSISARNVTSGRHSGTAKTWTQRNGQTHVLPVAMARACISSVPTRIPISRADGRHSRLMYVNVTGAVTSGTAASFTARETSDAPMPPRATSPSRTPGKAISA